MVFKQKLEWEKTLQHYLKQNKTKFFTAFFTSNHSQKKKEILETSLST